MPLRQATFFVGDGSFLLGECRLILDFWEWVAVSCRSAGRSHDGSGWGQQPVQVRRVVFAAFAAEVREPTVCG